MTIQSDIFDAAAQEKFAELSEIIAGLAENSTEENSELDLSASLVVLSRHNQTTLAEELIKKFKTDEQGLLHPSFNHFEILHGLINDISENSATLEIIQHLLPKIKVETTNEHGKDAVQVAAQQLPENVKDNTSKKITNLVKVLETIVATKKMTGLEGNLAEFALFAAQEGHISFKDLEHKNVFKDQDKMEFVLEDYSRKDGRNLESITDQLKESHQTKINLSTKQIPQTKPTKIVKEKPKTTISGLISSLFSSDNKVTPSK